MFQKLTLAIAIVAVGTCSGSARAQSGSSEASASDQQPVALASYGQNYASASGGYMQSPRAMAYGQTWGGAASNRDTSRFYHYPYVFYPQNFRSNEYYQSSDSMYYRYPPEMQIPVYNRHWHNYYPSPRRYHSGHHFLLDVF